MKLFPKHEMVFPNLYHEVVKVYFGVYLDSISDTVTYAEAAGLISDETAAVGRSTRSSTGSTQGRSASRSTRLKSKKKRGKGKGRSGKKSHRK